MIWRSGLREGTQYGMVLFLTHDFPLICTLHDLLYANICGRKYKCSISKQLKKCIHKTFDVAVYKHRSLTQ